MSLLSWNTIQVNLFKKHELTIEQIAKISVVLNPLRNRPSSYATKRILERLILIEIGVERVGCKAGEFTS